MPRRPHIVLITCHDLGRHLGCYGVPAARTPALDALAAEGVRFANSFCTSPGCSPSRAALATGRYPHCNGVLGLAHAHFGWSLSPGERHAASLLGEAGYYPALFGLQHVTYDVASLGFREIHPGRPADEVTANLERFIASRRGASDPLYCEINFFEPHRPFDFGGVGPDTEAGIYVPPYLPANEAAREEFALMQGAVHKVDRSVARIRAALESAGLLDETLFLFTADHGIAFPGAKGTLYDPGIATALIVRWPGGGATGGRVPDALISNVDVLPTLLEAAEIEIPARVQGESFRALLSGREQARRTEVFAEKTFHNEYDPLRCIRTGRWKLIARFEASNRMEVPADIMRGATYRTVVEQSVEPRTEPFELYDLQSDPLERTNLAGREEHAATEAALKQRLRDWMTRTDDPLLRGPVASPFYYRTVQLLQGA